MINREFSHRNGKRSKRERDRKTEREREREIDRQREREREIDRQREGEIMIFRTEPSGSERVRKGINKSCDQQREAEREQCQGNTARRGSVQAELATALA